MPLLLSLSFACNGPTREFYDPAEETATGGAHANGTGGNGTSTQGAGAGADNFGGAAHSAGGTIGAAGASLTIGGTTAAGASGSSTLSGGATGTATGVGGTSDVLGGAANLGGNASGAGAPSGTGGAMSMGGAFNLGGATAFAGAGGDLGGGGAIGKQLGATCSTGLDCASSNCVDGVCCSVSTCPECMDCGSTGHCNVLVTNRQDLTGLACTGARTCSAAGSCKGTKTAGQACTDASECLDGFCADGSCCKTACNGTCQTCDSTGTCQRTVMREDDSCHPDATGTRMCDAQGTCSMPHLLRDVNPTSYTIGGVTNTNPSYPKGFVQGPDRRVYFSATDNTAGDELWVTDGTATGTVLVANILAGTGNSSPRGLINAGSNLFFTALDSTGFPKLYATNGTAAGTHLVKELGNAAFAGNALAARSIGNTIYFGSCGGAAGCELWRSDGSDVGTVMVSDILNTPISATSTQTFGSNPSELTVMGSALYFRAANAIVGLGSSNVIADYELWKSDGLATNTVRVADIEPGVGNGMPTHLTPIQSLNGPRLVFAASRGTSNQELYFTNGSVGDLATVDIYPGPNGSYPGPFVSMGNRTYFQATDPTNGSELWATDGTPTGTFLVKDIYPGSASGGPTTLRAVGNFLYFRAADSSGYGLWRSDGTSNGTVKVYDAFTPSGAGVFQMAGLGNRMFVGTAGQGLQELWVTDGTTAGTYRTCPDRTQACGQPFASYPSDLVVIDARMYFNASALPTTGGSLGAEPFVYP